MTSLVSYTKDEGMIDDTLLDAAGYLGWALTGSINSLDHVAVVEQFQHQALCGTGIVGTREVRPKTFARLCPKCARELRLLRVDPQDIGIENDLL